MVRIKDGRVIAMSHEVAAYFKKRHDNILRDLDVILATGSSILSDQYFQQVTAFNPKANRETRHFEMSRDGFTLLAMGFTGAEALTPWVDPDAQALSQWELRHMTHDPIGTDDT